MAQLIFRCSGCGLKKRSVAAKDGKHAARLFRMDIAMNHGTKGTIQIENEAGELVYSADYDPSPDSGPNIAEPTQKKGDA